MSLVRKAEMSLCPLKTKSWKASFGLGDDEQAGLAAHRGLDRGAGWTTVDGVGCRRSERKHQAGTTAAEPLPGWWRRSPDPPSAWPGLELSAERRLREYALELVRQNYRDFGPTMAAEVLLERHGVEISRETLRKWMVEAGQWLTRKQRRTLHQPRRVGPDRRK